MFWKILYSLQGVQTLRTYIIMKPLIFPITSLARFALALSYPAATTTPLVFARLAHNLRLSALTVEWLWDCDV